MKVLVIGSGPVVVGQAAEFDYSGTQAISALKDEGHQVVLVNNNPATVMTDTERVDALYMEPLTVKQIEKIIHLEKPDALLASVGGQTGLNLALDLAKRDILKNNRVTLLGSTVETIYQAESRDAFAQLLKSINEPSVEGVSISSTQEALAFADNHTYPLVVRPAFTLGGQGGGMVYDETQLRARISQALKLSPVNQCLVEKSLFGLTEVEFEVLRDCDDNAIAVCHMENIDPVGIHTGDSVVVSPIQTLDNNMLQNLRSSALRIVRALKIIGACNVQYAVDVAKGEYQVIEVNPRVSRSSALASKATGYPIARIATILSLGKRLDEIENPITRKTAFFEPTLDYVVVKFPRWPFDKMPEADPYLGTMMKSTGEVMAIGQSFEEALVKAIRSLEDPHQRLSFARDAMSNETLETEIEKKHYRYLFYIYELLKRGSDLYRIAHLSRISPYFLQKIKALATLDKKLSSNQTLIEADIFAAKRKGFSDAFIASRQNIKESDVFDFRVERGILPVYKMVDTCGGEFDAFTPYYYSTYAKECELDLTQLKQSPHVIGPDEAKRYVIIGVGPVRIGQGIEFDYCCVKALQALRGLGHQAIMINNNPGTVSTDFDHSDMLFFEPLDSEGVLNVLHKLQPDGVCVQFGGQTSLNLADKIEAAGFTLAGASAAALKRAEDRTFFETMLDELHIQRPKAYSAQNMREALRAAEKLGYPLMLRPSFVTGGQDMRLIWNQSELEETAQMLFDKPEPLALLMDRFIVGKEVEVDVVFDGKHMHFSGALEHVEKSGVHSGDSMAVFPSQSITPVFLKKIEENTLHICQSLAVKGPVNIQYIVTDQELYVIEVNPRASRTVPFISKMSGTNQTALAISAMLDKPLSTKGAKKQPYVAIKAPVFSYHKISGSEVLLGPQMKSTGESIGIDTHLLKAFEKIIFSYGHAIPQGGSFILSLNDHVKAQGYQLARPILEHGFQCYATPGTYRYLKAHAPDLKNIEEISKIGRSEADILALIQSGALKFLVNIPSQDRRSLTDGFKMRRTATENGVLCFTSLDTVDLFFQAVLNRTTEVVNLNAC